MSSSSSSSSSSGQQAPPAPPADAAPAAAEADVQAVANQDQNVVRQAVTDFAQAITTFGTDIQSQTAEAARGLLATGIGNPNAFEIPLRDGGEAIARFQQQTQTAHDASAAILDDATQRVQDARDIQLENYAMQGQENESRQETLLPAYIQFEQTVLRRLITIFIRMGPTQAEWNTMLGAFETLIRTFFYAYEYVPSRQMFSHVMWRIGEWYTYLTDQFITALRYTPGIAFAYFGYVTWWASSGNRPIAEMTGNQMMVFANTFIAMVGRGINTLSNLVITYIEANQFASGSLFIMSMIATALAFMPAEERARRFPHLDAGIVAIQGSMGSAASSVSDAGYRGLQILYDHLVAGLQTAATVPGHVWRSDTLRTIVSTIFVMGATGVGQLFRLINSITNFGDITSDEFSEGMTSVWEITKSVTISTLNYTLFASYNTVGKPFINGLLVVGSTVLGTMSEFFASSRPTDEGHTPTGSADNSQEETFMFSALYLLDPRKLAPSLFTGIGHGPLTVPVGAVPTADPTIVVRTIGANYVAAIQSPQNLTSMLRNCGLTITHIDSSMDVPLDPTAVSNMNMSASGGGGLAAADAVNIFQSSQAQVSNKMVVTVLSSSTGLRSIVTINIDTREIHGPPDAVQLVADCLEKTKTNTSLLFRGFEGVANLGSA